MGLALSPWSGEFTDRRREAAFRATQATTELRQLRLLWSVALLCFLAFWPLDLIAASDAREVSIARIVILITGGVVLLLSRLRLSLGWRDSLACLGLVVAMAAYGLLLKARGEGPGALLLLVLGAYLFSPGRFAWHCASGLLGSLLALLLSDDVLIRADIAYLLPANLLAMLALAQVNRGRRRLYSEGLRLQKLQGALSRLHRQNTALLHNALPEDIARQLRARPDRRPARLVPMATVIYADLAGFSALARTLTPAQLVTLLNRLFSLFDAACERACVQKIKTLGDGYLAVAGLNKRAADGSAAVSVAVAMQQAVAVLAQESGLALSLRVGLHSGSLVAGVLGQSRYAFDVWGDTVNVACHLQAQAAPGTVLVSASTSRDSDKRYDFIDTAEYTLRGCGPVVASVLYAPPPDASMPITVDAMSSGADASQSTV